MQKKRRFGEYGSGFRVWGVQFGVSGFRVHGCNTITTLGFGRTLIASFCLGLRIRLQSLGLQLLSPHRSTAAHGFREWGLQGYLAHKKPSPSRTLQQAYA